MLKSNKPGERHGMIKETTRTPRFLKSSSYVNYIYNADVPLTVTLSLLLALFKDVADIKQITAMEPVL